jgi:hypothetical protein
MPTLTAIAFRWPWTFPTFGCRRPSRPASMCNCKCRCGLCRSRWRSKVRLLLSLPFFFFFSRKSRVMHLFASLMSRNSGMRARQCNAPLQTFQRTFLRTFPRKNVFPTNVREKPPTGYLKVKVAGEELKFWAKVFMTLPSPTLGLAVGMDGMWCGAFGFKPLCIGDIAGEISVRLTRVSTSLGPIYLLFFLFFFFFPSSFSLSLLFLSSLPFSPPPPLNVRTRFMFLTKKPACTRVESPQVMPSPPFIASLALGGTIKYRVFFF